MDDAKVRAYRILLAQGLLHLKWDLAPLYYGLSFFRPWRLLYENRTLRIAVFRAIAFHNLAIFAVSDFEGFSEEKFWTEIDRFHHDCPDSLCPYREVFERCLRDEPVCIVKPSGLE